MTRRLKYRANDGTEIIIETPWNDGTGIISPPSVTFRDSNTKTAITFMYTGESTDRYPSVTEGHQGRGVG